MGPTVRNGVTKRNMHSFLYIYIDGHLLQVLQIKNISYTLKKAIKIFSRIYGSKRQPKSRLNSRGRFVLSNFIVGIKLAMLPYNRLSAPKKARFSGFCFAENFLLAIFKDLA